MLRWESAWGVNCHFRDRNKPVPPSPIPRGLWGVEKKKAQAKDRAAGAAEFSGVIQVSLSSRKWRDWSRDEISFLSSALALPQPRFVIEKAVKAEWHRLQNKHRISNTDCVIISPNTLLFHFINEHVHFHLQLMLWNFYETSSCYSLYYHSCCINSCSLPILCVFFSPSLLKTKKSASHVTKELESAKSSEDMAVEKNIPAVRKLITMYLILNKHLFMESIIISVIIQLFIYFFK